MLSLVEHDFFLITLGSSLHGRSIWLLEAFLEWLYSVRNVIISGVLF